MKKPLLTLLVLAFLPHFGAAQQTASKLPFVLSETATYMPGKILMRLKPGYRNVCGENTISDPQLNQIFLTLQVSQITKAFPRSVEPREKVNQYGQELTDLSLIYELDLPLTADLEKAINLLQFSPAVEYAQPNYTYEALYDPSDPDTASQYYLALIQAREAWNISRGDSTIVIGIIDTGTSFTHPELQGRIALNLNDTIDGLDNDNDGYIDNYHGWDFGGDFFQSPGDNDPQWVGGPAADHGVLVSGPIAAISDNNINMASIGFDCRILPCKTNINNDVYLVRPYQAIVYAADHGASMMNMSFGGPGYDRFGEDATRYAAINKGCLLIGSSGNTVGDIKFYPASFPWVISAGGSMGADAFWNNGGGFGSTYCYQVDICAPAQNIHTTSQNGGCWSGATGTSMATPIVVGASVLTKAEFPTLSNHQIGQKVRIAADDIYSLNPGIYTQKMGRGRVNAYRALTDVSPSVRVAEIKYEDTDGDGLLMGGDTVLVRVRFMNYLDPVTNLSVTLTSPNTTQINVIHGDAYIGDLGTLDTISAWHCPFKIVVGASTANNFVANLKFTYTGTGYSDYEYYVIDLSPNFVSINQNDIETSIDNIGHFSIFNYPALSQGTGTSIESAGNYLLDAGFLFGTSATQVSNNVHNQINNQDAHFQSAQTAFRQVPGPLADLEATSIFNDNGAGANQHDITVTEKVYQYSTDSEDDYIIIEYEIHNDGASAITNAYAGMYSNWELGWPVNNYSRYDAGNRIVWAHEPIGTPPHHIGMSLLTNDSLHAFTDNIDSVGFTMAEKFAALTADPMSANSDTTDIVQFISAGPFTINAGASHKIAFAWLKGFNPSQIIDARAAALQKYNCVIRGQMSPLVDLGADIASCIGATNFVLDAGAGFSTYEWNTGASTQTISVTTSGNYTCTVTDVNGCVDYDAVSVSIGDAVNGNFSMSSGNVFTGDTVTFNDLTPGSSEWCWDFGDGTGECPVLSQTTHVFSSPGTYPVTLIVGDGPCSDTVTLSITVDSLVSITTSRPASGFTVYPNPAMDQLVVESLVNGCPSFSVSLLTLAGVEVGRQPATDEGRTLLDVTGLARGLYFLQVQCEGKVETYRVVLQ